MALSMIFTSCAGNESDKPRLWVARYDKASGTTTYSPNPYHPTPYRPNEQQTDPILLKAGNLVQFQILVDDPSTSASAMFTDTLTEADKQLTISSAESQPSWLEVKIADVAELRGGAGYLHMMAFLVAVSARTDAPVKETTLSFRHPVKFHLFNYHPDSLTVRVAVVPNNAQRPACSLSSSLIPLDRPIPVSFGCPRWPPDWPYL
jgi:hypothetical protein